MPNIAQLGKVSCDQKVTAIQAGTGKRVVNSLAMALFIR